MAFVPNFILNLVSAQYLRNLKKIKRPKTNPRQLPLDPAPFYRNAQRLVWETLISVKQQLRFSYRLLDADANLYTRNTRTGPVLYHYLIN